MTGEQLRGKIKATGLSISEVARKLGTGHQNLIQALAAQDVKTGLIEKLSRALDLPLSYFYEPEPKTIINQGDSSTAYANNGDVHVSRGNSDAAGGPIGSSLVYLAELIAKQESALADTKSLRADFISAIAELNQATAQNKILLTRLARFLDTEAQNYGLAADSLPQNSIKKVD